LILYKQIAQMNLVKQTCHSGRRVLVRAFDAILPERCALCLIVDPAGYCVDCQNLLPWIEAACTRCANPLAEPGVCGKCQQRLRECPDRQPDEIVVPFRYQNPVSAHIHRLKYRSDLSALPGLAKMLVNSVLIHCETLPEVLVPVPLHPHRLRRRGFNQAGLLATAVGRLLDIPVDQRHLVRTRDTPSQTSLDESQREHNLRGAFSLRGCRSYRSMALIDDVITSGATVRSACHAVSGSMTTRVSVWAIAKTAGDFRREGKIRR